MIRQNDMQRYHDAAKMIETDGIYAYNTVSKKYGEEIANFLVVAFLRRNHNPSDQWPAPENTIKQVREDLETQEHIQFLA